MAFIRKGSRGRGFEGKNFKPLFCFRRSLVEDPAALGGEPFLPSNWEKSLIFLLPEHRARRRQWPGHRVSWPAKKQTSPQVP